MDIAVDSCGRLWTTEGDGRQSWRSGLYRRAQRRRIGVGAADDRGETFTRRRAVHTVGQGRQSGGAARFGHQTKLIPQQALGGHDRLVGHENAAHPGARRHLEADVADAARPERIGRHPADLDIHRTAGAACDMDTLQRRHKPLLEIGRQLLGVIPNCHRYLEIWPPAFITYNVLVPNLLNVPNIVRSGYRLRELVSLAMFASSWAAGCRYCTAHTCAFAQLRGVDAKKVLASMGPNTDSLTTSERIVVIAAASLGQVPSAFHEGQRNAMESLENRWSPRQVEYIVLAIAMTGWLNQVMDTLGVPLESRMMTTAARSIAFGGWTPGKHLADVDTTDDWDPRRDGRATMLKFAPLLPSVLWRSREWTQGVPTRSAPLKRFLVDRTGYHWPLVADLRSGRARQAIAAMLVINMNPRTTTLGLRTKMSAAEIYAETAQNEWLHDVAIKRLRIHAEQVDISSGHRRVSDATEAAALDLAHRASSSPADVNAAVVRAATAALRSDQIIELVTWLAGMQLIHRLATYTHTPPSSRNAVMP